MSRDERLALDLTVARLMLRGSAELPPWLSAPMPQSSRQASR